MITIDYYYYYYYYHFCLFLVIIRGGDNCGRRRRPPPPHLLPPFVEARATTKSRIYGRRRGVSFVVVAYHNNTHTYGAVFIFSSSIHI